MAGQERDLEQLEQLRGAEEVRKAGREEEGAKRERGLLSLYPLDRLAAEEVVMTECGMAKTGRMAAVLGQLEKVATAKLLCKVAKRAPCKAPLPLLLSTRCNMESSSSNKLQSFAICFCTQFLKPSFPNPFDWSKFWMKAASTQAHSQSGCCVF